MKIKAGQLKGQLRNQTIILITGEENFLVESAISLSQKFATERGYNDIVKFDIESNNFPWQDLQLHSQHQSLFSDKKVIQLRINTTLNKKALSRLLEILKSTSDCFFLIQHKKLSKSQERQTLFQWIDQNGLWVLANPVPLHELSNWMRETMSQKGLETSSDGYELILDNTAGNLSACAQEIDKISLLFDSGFISYEQLKMCLTNSAQYTVFECVEQAVKQSPQKTLLILNHLRQSKTEPVLILWAALKEIRVLASLCFELDNGSLLSELWQKHHVWQSKQTPYAKLLKHSDKHFFYHLIGLAKEIDKQIKGINDSSVWQSLNVLFFTLSTAIEPKEIR